MLPRINQILLQNSWKLLIFSLHMHPPSSWYCLKSSVSSFCTLPSVPSPLSLVGTDAAGLLRTFPPLEPRHKAQYFVPSEFSSPFCPGLLKIRVSPFIPVYQLALYKYAWGIPKKWRGVIAQLSLILYQVTHILCSMSQWCELLDVQSAWFLPSLVTEKKKHQMWIIKKSKCSVGHIHF